MLEHKSHGKQGVASRKRPFSTPLCY